MLDDGTRGLDIHRQQPIPLYAPQQRRGLSFGKVLLIIAGISLFVVWALYLVRDTSTVETAQPTPQPTANHYQAVIDAGQLDAVQNEQLAQQMSANDHTNAVNALRLQATRAIVPVIATQTISAVMIEEANAQSERSIEEAGAAVARQIEMDMAQSRIRINEQAARADAAFLTVSAIALLLAAIGACVSVFFMVRNDKAEPKAEVVEPLTLPLQEARELDPAWQEFMLLVKELAEKRDESPVITNNYDNYNVNQRVLPHLGALESVGLTPEQIGRLPFRMDDVREGVPKWAVVAMKKLRVQGMNASVIAPLFGLNGTKNKIYQEVMK